ncbi:MAG: DUF4142 domain-containing protein [Nibricoccus sp.]
MKNPQMKTANSFQLLAACAALVFSAATLSANESENRGQLSSHDYKFACEALEGGTMEVTLGQLAQQKATDQAVREFGQRMVTDHQKANQELTQLLSQKGATPPNAMAKKSGKMTDKLQDEKGADFDKAYMKQMLKDHKKDVEEFQKASEKSDDADLRALAAKTLPTLQEHLTVAKSVEEAVSAKK